MRKSNLEHLVMTGAPLIGEGNIVDNKALLTVLTRVGIPCRDFYPQGPLVWLGRGFHVRMSMSTKKTMAYALNSDAERSSFKVRHLKWELRRAIKKAQELYPHAMCFMTSQSMMAEESVGILGDIPTMNVSSDVCGKYNHHSMLTERQNKIIHLVWNREALYLYKNILNLENVHLIKPVDPKNAFEHRERVDLPFQNALDDPNLCFIKLSGSGGDPKLINAAITSLWEKNQIKSIVFPGIEKTQKKIIKRVNNNVTINSSLDASVFYNHVRVMISHEQLLLTYPSEQVKHIAVLTGNNIFPNVAWLSPRGQHEVMNLAWAIKKGFSGTVCIPEEYHHQLKRGLMNLGVPSSEIECVVPEKLSAEHFKPSPQWQYETEAVPVENMVRQLTGFK